MSMHIPGKTPAIILSATLLLALTACKEEAGSGDEAAAPAASETASAAAPAVPAEPALAGTAWWVEDIGGQGVVDSSHTTLDLTRQGQVSGDTGCNRYTARAQIGDGTITFGAPGGTRKACVPALMDQEMAFYEAIGKVVSWEIADTGLLYLRDADGNDLLRAAATDDP
jgi:heat shock protein HslJ